MIEAPGFNCTLAPWQIVSRFNGSAPSLVNSQCKAENHTGNTQLPAKLAQWDSVYLADAQARISAQISGYDVTFRDTALMVSYGDIHAECSADE